jgi:hypothetical protein
MAIPTIDDVWRDFDVDGTPHEPVKEEIRRVLNFVQSIATTDGMKTYPTKAAMDADTTQPDGQAALLYADPTDANNYPTVWIWNDASNVWVQGVDRISSLKTTQDLLNNVARRVVVPGTEIVIDRLGLYGGGTNQMYLPRNVFSDFPAQLVNNATVGTDSAEKPGSAKLAIPQGIRVLAYADLTNNTFQVIQATGGDFAMPNLPADKFVPMIIFSADGTYHSPFRVRDLNPRTAGAGFLPTRPLVFSRFDNKVLIPGGTFRTASAGTITHTPAGGVAYEEFDYSTSGTNLITYWFNIRTNTYAATAAGVEPFTVDPTMGVVLGYSYGGEFWSPWPYVGISGEGRAFNTFELGKLPSLAPRVQVPGTAHIVPVNADLAALGFTEAMANSHATTGSIPAYGDNLPDNRWPLWCFARVYIQTTVADDFGNARVWFTKANAAAANSWPLTLEKKISSSTAIYSGFFKIPDPKLAPVDTVNPWLYYVVGTGNVGTPDRYAVTGVQIAFGPNVRWIDRGDYPTTPSLSKRVATLEAGQTVTDPAIAILYGPDMWVTSGIEMPLFPANINETRASDQRYTTGFVSMKHTLVDIDPGGATVNAPAVDTFFRDSRGEAIIIDPDRLGDQTYIAIRRLADNAGNPDLRYTRRAITVHKAPATFAPAATRSLAMIGDSLTGPATIKQQLKAEMLQRGVTLNFIGTMQTAAGKLVGNEGKGGWSFASAINQITLPAQPGQPVGLTKPVDAGQEAAYLAKDDDASGGNSDNKIIYNPFIRLATGGDPSGKIFNGYVFDYAWYLNRWAATSLGALPVPDLAIINLGTGDINNFSEPDTSNWITTGLNIMVDSMEAAGVPHIGIIFPCFPFSDRNAVWTEQASAIRTFLGWHKSRADPKVDLLPAWAHIGPDFGWVTNAADVPPTNVVDPQTGASVETITDPIHYYDDLTRSQINEVHAAWIAAKIAGV